VAKVLYQLAAGLTCRQPIKGYGASNSHSDGLVAFIQELVREQHGPQARVNKPQNLEGKPVRAAEEDR
jgi:hypothetical protein